MQWMTFQQSARRKIQTLESSVFLQRFNRVSRAGRLKSAASGKERRKDVLVCPYEKDEYFGHEVLSDIADGGT